MFFFVRAGVSVCGSVFPLKQGSGRTNCARGAHMHALSGPGCGCIANAISPGLQQQYIGWMDGGGGGYWLGWIARYKNLFTSLLRNLGTQLNWLVCCRAKRAKHRRGPLAYTHTRHNTVGEKRSGCGSGIENGRVIPDQARRVYEKWLHP